MGRSTRNTVIAWLGLGLFVAVSLGWLSISLYQLGPSGALDVPPAFQGGERVVSAWGLDYTGPGGRWLAIGESLWVVLAVLAASRGEGLLARLGLLGLVAWAGLWVVGLGRLVWVIGDVLYFGPWLAISLLGLACSTFLLLAPAE